MGSGGASPNPSDFRYASAVPASVRGVALPTGVPVIVPLTVSAVTDARRASHASPTRAAGGAQKPGGGAPSAGATGNARTASTAPRAAIAPLRALGIEGPPAVAAPKA